MSNCDNKHCDTGCTIDGIHCEVKNCRYHDESDCCCAGKITVGPGYATSNSDTACITFEGK